VTAQSWPSIPFAGRNKLNEIRGTPSITRNPIFRWFLLPSKAPSYSPILLRYSFPSSSFLGFPPLLISSDPTTCSDIPSHLPHFWGSLHFSYPPIRRPVPIFLPIFLISGVPSTPHILRSDDLFRYSFPSSSSLGFPPLLISSDPTTSPPIFPPILRTSEVYSYPPILFLQDSLLFSEPLRFSPPLLSSKIPPILRSYNLRTSSIPSYPPNL
jgi:hypothetical protein